RTLYRLKPETAHHILCKTDCLQFWPALTVKSKSTRVKLPQGIKGKIGYLKRGKRWQVTLGGKPLYTYSGDSAAHQVNGQNIKTFGGTWFSFPVKSGTTQQSPPPAPMPSWACIRSKPLFTSSSLIRWETNGSTSMSPASQRSTSWGTRSRPFTPPNDEPQMRRPVMRKRGITSS